jgi:acyl dehydratase
MLAETLTAIESDRSGERKMKGALQYFEDFELGLSGNSRSRTIGAPEIVQFAGITCDYAFLHMSEPDAKASVYGGRIAHGLLSASLVPGLLSLDAPQLVGRNVAGAYMSGFDISYRRPVRIDDTIHVAWTIVAKDAEPGLNGYGSVTIGFQFLDQHDQTAYDGCIWLMTLKRGASPDSAAQFRSASPWQLPAFDFDPDRPYSLDELPANVGGISSGRTMTEADIVNFAGLTGDFNPLYVDEQFAQASPFKGRIVPPMMVFTSAFALWSRDTWMNRMISKEGLVDFGHLNDSAVFLAPVRIGDTIRCVYRLASHRSQKSKPERKVLTHELQIINQRDEVVQTGRVFMSKAPG